MSNNDKRRTKAKGIFCGGFSFCVGQKFRRGPTIFEIVEDLGNIIVLRHAETHERKFIELQELVTAYLSHELVPSTDDDVRRAVMDDPFSEDDDPVFRLDFGDASDAAIEHGSKLIRYIRELHVLGYTNLRPVPLLELEFERLKGKLALVDEKFRNCSLELSTVYKTSLKIRKANGDWRAAIPHYRDRGGKGGRRIAPVAQRSLSKVWAELRARKNERIIFSDIEGRTRLLISQEVKADEIFDVMPARSTIERLTKAVFDQYDIDMRNRGEEYVKKKYKSYYPRDRVTRPLEVVEFDDKDSRVFLVNGKTGLPDGRGYVTSGVDQGTTIPLGFSISDKPRSTFSALSAFVNSILPKNIHRHEYSLVKSGVEFYGNIGIAIFDNTLYNHSNGMEKSIEEICNTILAWAKPNTPTEKSNVENFNGRMASEFFPNLPGYGGEKRTKKGLAKGLETAVLETEGFIQRLLKWSYDDYCNSPRGDGFTPRQLWHDRSMGIKPRLPLNIHKVMAAISIPHSLRLRDDGLFFTGLQYQNPRLVALRRKIGHNKYTAFRYHPEKLEQIYVHDPFADEYFIVANVNPEYTRDLTLTQHALIRKMARTAGVRNPNTLQCLHYKEELRKLTSQLRWSKKHRERKFANRYGFSDDAEPEKTNSSNGSVLMSDLEFQIESIHDVIMESTDDGWDLPPVF